MKARSLNELRKRMSDDVYERLEGVYSSLPTWGEQTPAVRSLIGRSCADRDIVSWDTRPKDVNSHRYLMRSWFPAHEAHQPEHRFSIRTHAEMVEDGWEL